MLLICTQGRWGAMSKELHTISDRYCCKSCSALPCRTVEEMLFGYEDELLQVLSSIVPSLSQKTRFQLMPNMTSVNDALALRRTVMNTHPVEYPALPSPGFAKSNSPGGPSNPSILREYDPTFQPIAPVWLPMLPTALAVPLKRLLRSVRGFFAGLERRATAEAAGWSYTEWQGRTEVTCWGEGHVESVIGGSDALQFFPGLTSNDSVHIFVPELFRMAKLNATGTVRPFNFFQTCMVRSVSPGE